MSARDGMNAETKAFIRREVETRVEAMLAESDQRLAQAVIDGHLDAVDAANLSAFIHADAAAQLPTILADAEARITAHLERAPRS